VLPFEAPSPSQVVPGYMDRTLTLTVNSALTTAFAGAQAMVQLELDRLIMKPGGGFPLASVNLVLGAVTSAGKLSSAIEYVEDNVNIGTMERIKEEAMESLPGE
jgi:hypothetical protein